MAKLIVTFLVEHNEHDIHQMAGQGQIIHRVAVLPQLREAEHCCPGELEFGNGSTCLFVQSKCCRSYFSLNAVDSNFLL